MKRLKINLQMAFGDFLGRRVLFSLIIAAFTLFIVGNSFLLRYTFEFELERREAFSVYKSNHKFSNLEVAGNGTQINAQAQKYVLEFINENEDIIIGMLQFDLNDDYYVNDLGFIGFGKFADFYNVPYKSLDEINLVSYGVISYEEYDLVNYTHVSDKGLNAISLYGPPQVLPFSGMMVVANFETVYKQFSNQMPINSIFDGMLFVDADQYLLDEFVNTVNDLDNNFFLKVNDLSEDISREMEGDLGSFLITILIVAIIFFGMYFLLAQLIINITEANIKEYTLNLLVGARPSDLFIRIFLLNVIIIVLASLVACIAVYLMNPLYVVVFPYIFIQSIVYMIILPIYPMVRLMKMDLYKNMRGELSER